MSPSFRKLFTFYGNRNNLQDLLGESHKKLNVIVATVLLKVEKKDTSYFLSQRVCIFFPRMKHLHTRKTCNGSDFGWLIPQMSINQKSGRQTFRGRFVSGSLFVSPCRPERYLQSERKIEPDLRLRFSRLTCLILPSDFLSG